MRSSRLRNLAMTSNNIVRLQIELAYLPLSTCNSGWSLSPMLSNVRTHLLDCPCAFGGWWPCSLATATLEKRKTQTPRKTRKTKQSAATAHARCLAWRTAASSVWHSAAICAANSAAASKANQTDARLPQSHRPMHRALQERAQARIRAPPSVAARV